MESAKQGDSVTMIDFTAQPDGPFGLVGVGGDLGTETLLHAYRSGVFPWYGEGEEIHWWSPDPRGIIEFADFHVSRRLARTLRSGEFRCTINQAFTAVMRGCAEREEGSWIHAPMIRAYTRLHQLGHALSVEVWRDDQLVGGIYGVALGAFFGGESMFHRVTDASKVAITFLVEHLKSRHFELFDAQILNAHTKSLGGVEISRAEYLRRLGSALKAE